MNISTKQAAHVLMFLPEMYSQASVFARALKTNPDSVGHTDPLGVEGSTFKTKLIRKHKVLDY